MKRVTISTIPLLLLILFPITFNSSSVFAAQWNLEIVAASTGRCLYGKWWPIDAFARTAPLEIQITLRNKLDVALPAKVTATISDEAGYTAGYCEKLVTIQENTTQNVILGPVQTSKWARIGQATVYLNVRTLDGTPLCPETVIIFYILPPVYYTLTLKTCLVTGEQCPAGSIWVDEAPYSTPTDVIIFQGIHVLKAASIFYYYDVEDGLVSTFIFTRWDNNSSMNMRSVSLYSSIVIVGYYSKICTRYQPK